jgi:hypothetical protein
MNCEFKNHTNVKNGKMASELVYCPLLFADGKTRTICLHHCLRLQGIVEKVTETIL